MTRKLEEKLNNFFNENPIARGRLHTLENIEHIENKLKLKLDENYREFLLKYGGSIVRNVEIYGVHNSDLMDEEDVIELNHFFKEDTWEGITDWCIIGSDYSGNPVGINEKGEILCNDHDAGGIFILADSFETYLEGCLLGKY